MASPCVLRALALPASGYWGHLRRASVDSVNARAAIIRTAGSSPSHHPPDHCERRRPNGDAAVVDSSSYTRDSRRARSKPVDPVTTSMHRSMNFPRHNALRLWKYGRMGSNWIGIERCTEDVRDAHRETRLFEEQVRGVST